LRGKRLRWVNFDFRQDYPEAGAEIEIELRDGRKASAKFDAGIPNSDIAAQGRRLAEKFDALAAPVVGAARARELREAIAGLDGLKDSGVLAKLAAK